MNNPKDEQKSEQADHKALDPNNDRGYPKWVPRIAIAAFVAAVTFGVLVGLGSVPRVTQDKLAQLGQLGDFVGGITNPLLAFLTFTALIYTINLQRRQLDIAAKQLDLMRQELQLSRAELVLSREALEESSNELKRSATAQEKSTEANLQAAQAQQRSVDLQEKESRRQLLVARRADLMERIRDAIENQKMLGKYGIVEGSPQDQRYAELGQHIASGYKEVWEIDAELYGKTQNGADET